MISHDRWLDQDLDDHYADLEDLEIPWPDEPATYPDDYDNYDGWDDIQ